MAIDNVNANRGPQNRTNEISSNNFSPASAASPKGVPNSVSIVPVAGGFMVTTYDSKGDPQPATTYNAGNKMNLTAWNQLPYGQKLTLLQYADADKMDLAQFMSTDLLSNQELFYSLGYLPVQAGDKILITNGAAYANNLSTSLGKGWEVSFNPYADGSKGLAAGLNIKVGDAWINAGNSMTETIFGTLNDEQQWSLLFALAGKFIPDDFISQDLLKNKDSLFYQRYQEVNGNREQPDLDGELDQPLEDFTIESPTFTSSEMSGNFTDILRQYGMMGNADAWAMGLMYLSSTMQTTLTQSLTANLEINKKYDDFLFNKTLLLNKRIFKTIREGNAEFQRAQEAAGYKRSAAQRWNSIWDNIGKGNWGKAFEEAVSLVYDATIGQIMNAVTWVIAKVGKEINKLVANITQNLVSPETQKQIEDFIGMWDEMSDNAESSMKLEKHEYGDTTLMTEEEAAAKEAGFNTLSEEEAQYLTYADITGLFGLTNSEVRDVADKGKTAMKVMEGIAIADIVSRLALSIFLGPGAFLIMLAVSVAQAVPVVSGGMQSNEVIDANTFTIESNYRQAQYKYIGSRAQAVSDAVGAARDALSQDMELLGKDVAMSMEFLSAMEDLLNMVLEQVADLGQGAAKGFAS